MRAVLVLLLVASAVLAGCRGGSTTINNYTLPPGSAVPGATPNATSTPTLAPKATATPTATPTPTPTPTPTASPKHH